MEKEQVKEEVSQKSEKENLENTIEINGEKINKKQEEIIETKENKKFNKVEGNNKKIEKQKEEMLSKKKKRIRIILLLTIIVIIMAFVSTIFAILNLGNDTIISGITIDGVEVSGLTKKEAKAKLDTIYEEKKSKEITIKYEDYISTLNTQIMEVEYDTEKVVEEAYLKGRESNIFANNYTILLTLINKKNLRTEMTLNEEVTRQTIEDIGTNIPGIIIEASYSIDGDKLLISKGSAGVIIDTDQLLEDIKENLQDINTLNTDLIIPVKNKEPEEIDIQKIHDEVYKEAQNAYYTKDPFTVYPEVIGIDFDVEEAKAILESEEKEIYEIPLIVTNPEVTIEQIGTEAFPDQLATFTTRYDASDIDRTTNLRIACEKINGKVLLAGETFSYNQTLGPRTEAAGYKNAKVYESGQVVDGIGGGICQISSTLYNAVLMSNLEIVERTNHQFVTSYVEAGRDATVVYGLTDFKFKNTRKYPIKIVASISGGVAKISIYGIKEEQEYTFSFVTNTISTIPYSTQYIEDSSLPVGTEKVKQKGANGKTTETYMTKMLNGQVVSTTLLSKDTYSAMTRIVLKGTGGSSTTTQSTTNTTEQNTNTSSTSTNTTTNSTQNNTSQTNTTTTQNTNNEQNNNTTTE